MYEINLALSLILIGSAPFLAFARPQYFVYAHLLLTTKYLGLVDVSVLEAYGLPNPKFAFNILAIAASLYTKSRTRVTVPTRQRIVLFAYSCFFIFGVAYPMLNGDSALFPALIDGHELMSISILLFLSTHKDKLNAEQLENFFMLLACSLGIVLISSSFLQYTPPAYVAQTEGGRFLYAKVAHVSYLSLGLFLCLGRLMTHGKQQQIAFATGIILTALLIQAHRSVLLASLLGCVIMLMKSRSHRVASISFVAGISIVAASLAFYGPSIIATKIVEPVIEFRYSRGAIAARNRVNFIRREAISNRPMLGYGFIDETSRLGETVFKRRTSIHNQRLGTIDNGYLDLRVRYGLIGLILYVAIFCWLVRSLHADHTIPGSTRLTIVAFLSTYFLVGYTWSVFTYEHGIVPISVSVFLATAKTSVAQCKHHTFIPRPAN